MTTVRDIVCKPRESGRSGLVSRRLGDLEPHIRSIAAGVDASIAETFRLLGPDDLVGGADCLHANDFGHRIIADAFAEAIED